MSALNNGGPAFPVNDPQVAHDAGAAAVLGIEDPAERDRLYTEARAGAVQGMTMRDYFAAKVMAALAADANRGPDTLYMNYEAAARESYVMADAMLAERAKEQP